MSPRGAAGRSANALRPIGLVVEGDAEFAAFPLLHKNKLVTGCPPLKAVNLGGVGADTKPVGIARLVVKKVIAYQVAGCARVVVCIDREHRDLCAPQLAIQVMGALKTELQQKGRSADDVHVVVADRAFEAWLLADARGLHTRRVFKRAPGFHSFEGQLGERRLLGVVELTNLLGRTYSKTKDGPQLFSRLDFAAARAHSRGGHGSKSLDKFLRTLGL